MPPAVSHHRPYPTATFAQYQQPHTTQQTTHYPHQNANFPSHIAAHPGFPATHPNGHANAFSSGLTNGMLPGNFGTAQAFAGTSGSGLGSQEAQMRFHQGAVLQQQQAQEFGGTLARTVNGVSTRIREVWRGNLVQEMQMIRSLVEKYPYVSMDTEFPGVVARPMGNFPTKADYHYQCLRCNVDLLKLIQLGITLFSAEGDLPPAHADTPLNRGAYPNNLIMCPCTWTFNFQFNLEEDMYSEDSIAMLKKAGVDFDKNAEMGIDPREFGSLLITSGLVLDDNVSWLSFHSGYDFGYLVKIMACKQLPNDEEEYLKIVRTWFPRIYDIKYLFRFAQKQLSRGILSQHASSVINNLGQKSGLQDIADELGCVREGRSHTAGSDAWLTGLVFWQMRNKIFDNQVPEDLIGMIWGLSGVGPPASAASQAAAMAGHQTPSTNGATLYHTGMTPSTYKTGEAPTTPQTSHSGLSSTPGPHGHGYPAMGGGVYNYQQQYGR